MKATIPVIYCTLVAMLRSAYGCSVAGRAYTQTELYYLSTTTVLGVFHGKHEAHNGQYYIWDYSLEVRCILKNVDTGTSIPNNIIVRVENPRVPSTDSCMDFVNSISIGLEAIVMLEKGPYGTYYTFWRKNLSSPLRSYTHSSMSAILQVCGYQQPQPPAQASSSSCPTKTVSAAACTTGTAGHVKAPNWFILMALSALTFLFHS